MSGTVDGRERFADVPGARLRYRLAGTPTALPLLVFENGWGASYECWARLEPLLAPHARLLFYNRAGVGGSICSGPQTVPGLSAQLAGLLAALKIHKPVILVGHSYGGLMCAVHAAQKPWLLRALVELDPTPDCADPMGDQQLKMAVWLGRLALLCARLGIPDPFFSIAGKLLPPPHGKTLVERSFGSAQSLRAALEELKLLDGLRAAVAGGDGDRPHLILSAGRPAELSGVLRAVVSRGVAERPRMLMDRTQEQHRNRAGRCRSGSWETLPHDHGGLVFSERGAKDSAARTLRFVREQC
jgi:pimeloyl-ACP methyl ester carboxylesterase